MITHRLLQAEDYGLLLHSLQIDREHPDMTPLFFVEPDTITNVYEDEQGPILFVRGKAIVDGDVKSIQLDIHYVSNEDRRRNRDAMLHGFPELVANARVNGFNKITFESTVPILRAFCIKRLGFHEGSGQTLEFMLQ